MTDHAHIPISQPQAGAALEDAITRALDHPPEIAIPADFAARVRASLPAQSRRRNRPGAARIAGAGAAAGVLIALCWLAPHAAPNFQSLAFDMELTLLAELAAIAAWLAIAREPA